METAHSQGEWELQTVLKDLHTISGFRFSVHDTKFREMTAYPRAVSPYCQLIQSTEAGRCRCVDNDLNAFDHVRRHPEVYLYKCCFGLYEAVAPLYVQGNLVGYLMMGQSIDGSDRSRDALLNNAAPYVRDRDALLAAVEDVCRCESDKILSSMKVLDICAQYITLSNRFFLDKSDLAEKIKGYLDEHFAEAITVEEIALKFFASRTTVMKAFKNKYGMGIIDYLARYRMQKARQWLLNTDESVKTIAERCGYPDQNYFSKVFVRHNGITPTAFRQQKYTAG